ncbi:leishmanolysin-related zinc metalloendopeptidase [Marimonas arenosa]|uniref:Leishmanolysin n=1 Tax=Marimonas arenosa TaxID=1795305 RepID=A0AAE3WC76_9RHOB|nr:leishmanolysin-related zinc metalloendopeptidase [Marimonas arenosa]MDQ2089813.1 leishmanolysin [Marimonas arenosa]
MLKHASASRLVGTEILDPVADVFQFGRASFPAAHRLAAQTDAAAAPAPGEDDKTGTALGADDIADSTTHRDGDGTPSPDEGPAPVSAGDGNRDENDNPRVTENGGETAIYEDGSNRDENGAIVNIGPLISYTSGGDAATSYNITIEFEGTWTEDLQQAFIAAADYLSQIILADLPDVLYFGTTYDDITISAELVPIDGSGGILGQAGPTLIRNGTYLPYEGMMQFDMADAETYYNNGLWDAIVLHEMLHTLGFGTMWAYMGLTTGSVSGGDIRFTGENATAVYQYEFTEIAANDPDSDIGIPIETDGGAGTAGGHWDETLFNQEIMTGYIDSNNFLSEMTVAALEDMGYDTVFDSPLDANDLYGPMPVDLLGDLVA